jgi:hypothetical protein
MKFGIDYCAYQERIMTTQRHHPRADSPVEQRASLPNPASVAPAQLSHDMKPHYWVNAQTGRYYVARLLTNLFGQWELEQAWGSLSSQRGRLRYVPLESWSEGQTQLRVVARRRLQRGYVATEPAVAG